MATSRDPWASYRRPLLTEPPLPAVEEMVGRFDFEAEAVKALLEAGFDLSPLEVASAAPGAAPGWFRADPAALERVEAKLAMPGESYDPTVGLDANLKAMARQVENLRDRWEVTLARSLRRIWDRRAKVTASKVRSVQFRRDTPLWDPPGSIPVSERLGMLVDLDAWDAELREEFAEALGDLRAEAVATMGTVEAKDDETFADFLATWIEFMLGFNRTAADAVRKVLAAKPTRATDVEDRVNDHITKTMHYVGDQIATSVATGAVNQAQYEAASSAPAVFERIWFTAQDGRVRPQHRHVNLQRVPMGKPFTVRDRKGVPHAMLHPGDLSAPGDLRVNCRCVQLFVTARSGDTWMRPDGSPIDPYGRATVRVAEEAKGVDAALVDPAWAVTSSRGTR